MTLFLDFDSTFITTESLDILAEVAGCDFKTQEKIKQLTERAMNGELSFYEALKQRLQLIQLNKTDIEQSVLILKKHISPSFQKNKHWLKKHASKMIFLSGGFKEMIVPLVAEFGFRADQVYANEFVFSYTGEVLGVDKDNPLAHDGGKVIAAKNMACCHTGSAILGDGYNDFLLKKMGVVQTFYLFTENVCRETLIPYADKVVSSLDELTELFGVES